MADQKISQLAELTTISNDDLFVVVDDPAGSPETKKITFQNLQASLDPRFVNVSGDTMTGALTLADLSNALNSGDYPIQMIANTTDGATALGYIFDTTNTFATDGSRVASFRTNGNEIAFIGRDNGHNGFWTHKIGIGENASTIDKYSILELNDTMVIDNNTPNGTGMLNIGGTLNFTGAIRQASGISVDIDTTGVTALPFPSGMLFQVSKNDNMSWGSNPGIWGQEPVLLATRWKSEAGSSALGAWVVNIVASTPSFAGGVPNGTYSGFSANAYDGTIGGTPNVYGLYIWGQKGTTEGAGIFIKPQGNAGIILNGDGDAGRILFGAGRDAEIKYDGTDLSINPKLVGTGKVFIGGDLDIDSILTVTKTSGQGIFSFGGGSAGQTEFKLGTSGRIAGESSIFRIGGLSRDIRFSGGASGNTDYITVQDVTGNFGINNLSPLEKLDVVGNVKIDSASTYMVGSSSGVSGTFTTTDGKTVTVTKGIITSIV